MNEVIKFPGKDKTATKPVKIKVGNDQPSPSDTIIRGQKAQARLEAGSGQVWSDWCDLIRALAECQNRAMREAETNKPQGPNYRKAIGRLLRCYGFDRIDKADRSRLIGYAADLAAMDKWRASQPNERQLDLNHPRVVAAGWKRSLRPKPERSPSSETDSTTDTAVPAVITIAEVLAWLSQASQTDKRRVAVALAQDTAAMKEILPAKVLPRQATPEQVFRKAMGLLSSADDGPAVH
jgi:hypothetical protein